MTHIARLKAEIWAKAHIRRCEVEGAVAMVARRGDDTSGIILLKLYKLGKGFAVLTPIRDGEGNFRWLRATGEEWVGEDVANGYIARQTNMDPDIWVLEIEDRQGRPFVDDPIDIR
jgi:hypothetical protein